MSLSAIMNGLPAKSIFGFGVLEMERRRNLFVMENESRFDQARNSGGIGRMPNVSLDGADVAELLLVGLALKNFAQRFEFNRVADGSAGAVRFDVANGLDGNIRVRPAPEQWLRPGRPRWGPGRKRGARRCCSCRCRE